MGGADTERPPKGEPVWVVAVRLLAYEMEPGRGQDSAPHPPAMELAVFVHTQGRCSLTLAAFY